jgi:hypothetical protein
VKTIAQTAVSVLLASEVVGLLEVSWLDLASVSGLAGIISLLTSVANYKKAADGK